MSNSPSLDDTESAVLQAVHAEGNADLYALVRAIGTGPRAVQEAVQSLSQKNLVVVEDGVEVCCTPSGEEVARAEQDRTSEQNRT
ncbi:MAG: Lrp/AsnC family transcriptional regulator [Bacteroidetes bacterium SW_9_63_38]|nr:MAG: Lrp/AsnC family transcriptional regulator [Bacteroidetes bacterium SW_9_63_38]